MYDDRNTIACQPNVKLYPVCAIAKRTLKRTERVFGSNRSRAAMTNDEKSGQRALSSGQ
jgi:hypothetical protein